MKTKLNHLQAYLAQEFVDDYHDGRLTRRELIYRILFITGGVASGAMVLMSMGCEPSTGRTPTPLPPPASTPDAGAAPTPGTTPSPTPGSTPAGSASKLSVTADDPAITASDVTFPGDGATLMAYDAWQKALDWFKRYLV